MDGDDVGSTICRSGWSFVVSVLLCRFGSTLPLNSFVEGIFIFDGGFHDVESDVRLARLKGGAVSASSFRFVCSEL